VAEHGVEKDYSAGYVGDIERTGILDRLFDEGLAGKMHDRVYAMFLKDLVEAGGIAEVGYVESGLRRGGGGMPFAQVIEGDDVDAGGDEEFRAYTADVAGPTGDENVQARLSSAIA
jgi:hypothetical protein